ncbi:hypothetical protein PF008_g31547 [Phytophthora fragariae]|uniref:Uncharacterized protein n=1 Tax=Phytophthora fragariae TaxID=53985 RepID=A0A6G0Q2G9_9STRA|nr:hypothetical protein PF008_g31547 [Phytophthora fragariae]
MMRVMATRLLVPRAPMLSVALVRTAQSTRARRASSDPRTSSGRRRQTPWRLAS